MKFKSSKQTITYSHKTIGEICGEPDAVLFDIVEKDGLSHLGV